MFETYPELVPRSKANIYEPRIFGFRVNERSAAGPRMQWLRMKPDDNNEDYDEEEDIDDRVKKRRLCIIKVNLRMHYN